MSPERDEPTEDQDQELYEDVPPRSIFAATWFRVVLVVIVLGVIGAVAVPYVLDWMNPPPPPRTAATRIPGSSTPPSSIFDRPAAAPDKPAPDKPATDKPATDKPPGDKPLADKGDKKEPSSTLIPAPAPVVPSTPPPATPPKPEPKSEPRPAPAPTAKAAPESKPIPKPAPAPSRPAPADGAGKTAAAVTEAPSKPPAAAKPEAKGETKAAAKPSGTKPAASRSTTAAASGPFWVQVGAFKDPETAKRLATKLRDDNFKVEESVRTVSANSTAGAASAPKPAPAPTAPSGSDQYDVFVTGMSVEELNKKLSGRGLAAETSGAGVVVKPSLPLRDAVALSKDLATEGFKVQVRRAGGGAAAPTVTAPAASTGPEGGTTLHRVRVGSFSDRAAALAAARELEAKGYKPFIARGDQ